MPTVEILKTYSVIELKREIGKARIKGYSKLKKAEVLDLMMKNKEKFHHLKGKSKAPKATGGAKPAPKPKAKPAKKEPAFLPDNVMANIKGFMNVGKDAKDFKDTVYQYVSGGKTYYLLNSKWKKGPEELWGKGAKPPGDWWSPKLPDNVAYQTSLAYLRILHWEAFNANLENNRKVGASLPPKSLAGEQTKIQKKIEESSPVYFIKTILPVLRQKDAPMKLAKSYGKTNEWQQEQKIKDYLKPMYLGETRKPRSKKLRFIKI